MPEYVARQLVTPSVDVRAALHLSGCASLAVPTAILESGLPGVAVRDHPIVASTAQSAVVRAYGQFGGLPGIVTPCACVAELGPAVLSWRALAAQIVEHLGWDTTELDRVDQVVDEVCADEAEFRTNPHELYLVAEDATGSPLLRATALDTVRARAVAILTTRA